MLSWVDSQWEILMNKNSHSTLFGGEWWVINLTYPLFYVFYAPNHSGEFLLSLFRIFRVFFILITPFTPLPFQVHMWTQPMAVWYFQYSRTVSQAKEMQVDRSNEGFYINWGRENKTEKLALEKTQAYTGTDVNDRTWEHRTWKHFIQRLIREQNERLEKETEGSAG